MEKPQTNKVLYWTGWVLSLLPMPLLALSIGSKLAQVKEAVEGFTKMGIPGDLLLPIGIVELVITILYLVPRTAVLGAIRGSRAWSRRSRSSTRATSSRC